MLPDAHHQVAGQQHLLDRRIAALAGRVEGVAARKPSVKRLHPQAAEQLDALRRSSRRARTPRRRTARVVQAQHAAAGRRRSKWSCVPGAAGDRREAQAARHAQVQQQQALVQVQQQVLAAPAHASTVRPDQLLRHARPAASAAACPARTASILAPAMRSAKLRRVTSTSGSSGMGNSGNKRIRPSDGRRLGLLWFDETTDRSCRRTCLAVLHAAGPGRPAAPACHPQAARRSPAATQAPPASFQPGRRAVLPVAARRNQRAATASRPTRLLADARRGPQNQRRPALPARRRHRVPVALGRRGPAGRAGLEAGASRLARSQSLCAADPGRAQSHRRHRGAAENRNRSLPPRSNAAGLAGLPRIYSRVSDKKLAAAVVEQALADYLNRPATAAAAWTAVGRMRLAAGEQPGALEAAKRAQAIDAGRRASPAGAGTDGSQAARSRSRWSANTWKATQAAA